MTARDLHEVGITYARCYAFAHVRRTGAIAPIEVYGPDGWTTRGFAEPGAHGQPILRAETRRAEGRRVTR